MRAAGIGLLSKVLAGIVGMITLGVLIASAYQVWQHPDRAVEVSRGCTAASSRLAPHLRTVLAQLLIKFFTGPVYILALICLEVTSRCRVAQSPTDAEEMTSLEIGVLRRLFGVDLTSVGR